MKKCNNFILVFDMTLKNHLKCGLISSIHERHTSHSVLRDPLSFIYYFMLSARHKSRLASIVDCL